MAYAISLWFSRADEERIRAIWQVLHEKQLTSFLWSGNFRPHVTLAIYEKLDVAGFAGALRMHLEKITRFEITLPALGLFCSPPGDVSVSGNAVFLSVTPTKGLLEFHATVHTLLAEFGESPRPYYLPDRWNPHSTLAREIASDQIPEVVAACQKFQLPIRPLVDRIGIIDTPAEIELECCYLS